MNSASSCHTEMSLDVLEEETNTKCGSHSAEGSVIVHDYMDALPKRGIRRCNFVKALYTNPLMVVPSQAWISKSGKLEHGRFSQLFSTTLQS